MVLRIVEMFAAASIPFLMIFSQLSPITIVTAIVGLIVAASAGILTLYRFQENWVKFRTTCESLQHHKFRFLTQTDPYDTDNAYKDFVNNVEALISTENTDWGDYIKNTSEEDEHGKG